MDKSGTETVTSVKDLAELLIQKLVQAQDADEAIKAFEKVAKSSSSGSFDLALTQCLEKLDPLAACSTKWSLYCRVLAQSLRRWGNRNKSLLQLVVFTLLPGWTGGERGSSDEEEEAVTSLLVRSCCTRVIISGLSNQLRLLAPEEVLFLRDLLRNAVLSDGVPRLARSNFLDAYSTILNGPSGGPSSVVFFQAQEHRQPLQPEEGQCGEPEEGQCGEPEPLRWDKNFNTLLSALDSPSSNEMYGEERSTSTSSENEKTSDQWSRGAEVCPATDSSCQDEDGEDAQVIAELFSLDRNRMSMPEVSSFRILSNETPLLLGRSRHLCQVVISNPRVSRTHAMILAKDGVAYLTVLSHSNSVMVDGKRVTNAGSAKEKKTVPLTHNCFIVVGTRNFRIAYVDQKEPEPEVLPHPDVDDGIVRFGVPPVDHLPKPRALRPEQLGKGEGVHSSGCENYGASSGAEGPQGGELPPDFGNNFVLVKRWGRRSAWVRRQKASPNAECGQKNRSPSFSGTKFRRGSILGWETRATHSPLTLDLNREETPLLDNFDRNMRDSLAKGSQGEAPPANKSVGCIQDDDFDVVVENIEEV